VADEIAISAVSAWEVAMLAARGRIELDRPPAHWLRAALAADPRVAEAPLTASIAVRAATLDDLHGDPADRFIYATARDRDASLVTRDEALRRHDPARTIW
jgi:PIN domain nuclease of toxin-antitoxin system